MIKHSGPTDRRVPWNFRVRCGERLRGGVKAQPVLREAPMTPVLKAAVRDSMSARVGSPERLGTLVANDFDVESASRPRSTASSSAASCGRHSVCEVTAVRAKGLLK